MKALYRTVSALLAIVSGLAFAMLITSLTDEREIKVIGFAIMGAGALLAAIMALVLWSKTLDRK